MQGENRHLNTEMTLSLDINFAQITRVCEQNGSRKESVREVGCLRNFGGQAVSARVEATEVFNQEKNVLCLSTRIRNQNGDTVIDGFAVVKAPMGGDC